MDPHKPTEPGSRAASNEPEFLRGLWYLATPGHLLKPKTTAAKTLLGEPVLFGRDEEGHPFAVRNICAHRGMPLDCGSFDGRELECSYHGWRFDTRGVCTEIPALVEGQNVDVCKISIRAYPCIERNGNVWVYFGDPDDPLPPVPRIPGFPEARPQIVRSLVFPVPSDHAILGLIDPAHVPFVHRSSWYRPRGSMHEKAKRFEPHELGFRMVRHAPSRNSLLYRVLGSSPETEINFQLPGLRIEHIQVGKHQVCSVTAMTPIDEHRTEVHHMIYWTIPWLSIFKPLVHLFARTFLDQDRRIVEQQSRGLEHDPQLMMIHDADTLARWYHTLKREFRNARLEGRPFRNSVPAKVLRWRT